MPSYSIKTSSNSDEETDHKYPLRNKTQNGRVIGKLYMCVFMCA